MKLEVLPEIKSCTALTATKCYKELLSRSEHSRDTLWGPVSPLPLPWTRSAALPHRGGVSEPSAGLLLGAGGCHHPRALQRAAKIAPLLIDRLLWVPSSRSRCLHHPWPCGTGTCASLLLHPPANTAPATNPAEPSPRLYQSPAQGLDMTKLWHRATAMERWERWRQVGICPSALGVVSHSLAHCTAVNSPAYATVGLWECYVRACLSWSWALFFFFPPWILPIWTFYWLLCIGC